MITNALQMLHTTVAYQTAALQLMVGEANFTAERLGLNESVPAVANIGTNEWEVEPPPQGVGGTVASANYYFWFHEGKLRSVSERRRFHSVPPPAQDLYDVSKQPSLLNSDGVYQLATQRLAALSVDIAELERKFKPNIFQVRMRARDPSGQELPRSSGYLETPLFELGWGNNEFFKERLLRLGRTNIFGHPPGPDSVITMEILASTKEVLSLEFRDPSLLRRPLLQLTNSSELLGPTPPPRHFVEGLVGGKEAYDTLARPDKVEVWLLTSSLEDGTFTPKTERAGPVKLKVAEAKMFSDVLSNFDSYLWGVAKGCMPDYGARIRFTRGRDVVEFLLCYECDMLEVKHNGQTKSGDFDPSHTALLRAIQAVFPNDAAIKKFGTR